MPLIGEVKKTYSRKAHKAIISTAPSTNFPAQELQSVNKHFNSDTKSPLLNNITLNDSDWKDSFDKICGDKRLVTFSASNIIKILNKSLSFFSVF